VDPKRIPRGGIGALSSSSPAAVAAAKGAAQGQAKAGLAESIDRLAADVQQLRVDFERFMSGALLFPPEELRQRIQAQLRQLRNASAMTAVDRFRLGDLEARYNSYNELFNRRLREREEGRPRTGHVAPPPSVAPPPPPPRYDAAAGILIGRSPDPGAVAALYDGLTATAPGGAGVGIVDALRFDLASFGSYLERQAAAIRDKTGCEEVQFRLAAEDGKLKLKARPVGGGSRPRS
jgi:hypothetical protein